MELKTNFRPAYPLLLNEVNKSKKQISIYRGRATEFWNSKDLQSLVENYKIKTIIDLRFPPETDGLELGVWNGYYDEQINNSLIFHPKFEPCRENKPTRYVIGMCNWHFYFYQMCRMTMRNKIGFLYHLLLYFIAGKTRFISYTGQYSYGDKDLPCLYMDFIDFCKTTIKEVFLLLQYSNHYPTMILCQQGKDRTAVLCFLIQDLMQCSPEQIDENFSKSEALIQSEAVRLAVIKNLAACGIGANLVGASKEAFAEFRKLFQKKYSSAYDYLIHIGLTENQIYKVQETIRNHVNNDDAD